MAGDRNDFMDRVKPFTDELIDLARHELRYHQARGEIEEKDLTAEEVVGETLIAAYKGQTRKPASASWRAWLFRLENRVIHRLIQKEEKNRSRWSFSMDEPIPDLPEPFGDDVFWDWHQPDEKDRWEDVLFGFEPVSEDLVTRAEEVSREFDPLTRRAWLLFERFGFSIPETAQILGQPPARVAKSVSAASGKLREALRKVRE